MRSPPNLFQFFKIQPRGVQGEAAVKDAAFIFCFFIHQIILPNYHTLSFWTFNNLLLYTAPTPPVD